MDAGGVLLVVALVLMIRAVRRGGGSRWALWTHRIVLVVIPVGIPVGLTLAHLRAP